MQLNLIENLISALRSLPSIGPKSAQRMAYHILQHARQNGLALADSLEKAIRGVKNCRQCRTLSDNDLCHICSDLKRDQSLLCVVESPLDVMAIEQTNSYKGLYFVLLGHLSPLDGIGPEALGMNDLTRLLQEKTWQEVIIATNPTVEGEATAYYVSNLIHSNFSEIKVTRLAFGVPMGGELEYIDSNTLYRALDGRGIIQKDNEE